MLFCVVLEQLIRLVYSAESDEGRNALSQVVREGGVERGVDLFQHLATHKRNSHTYCRYAMSQWCPGDGWYT